MRTIGAAEEALKAMVKRLQSRVAFGKRLMEHSIWEQRVARARIDIDMSRLLCLKAADLMDKAGNKAAAGRDRDDQGLCAEHGAAGSSTTRSRRMAAPACQPGFRAGGELGGDPDAAPRRRAGRGAQPGDRADRVREACGGTKSVVPSEGRGTAWNDGEAECPSAAVFAAPSSAG